jgi:dihydrodipicolinate synthase/N-acetylneuraminate lyase
MTAAARFTGVFPVAPTIFDEHGALDLSGQRRCIDFLIDAGADGVCILANYSEQFAVTDAERELLTDTILHHVAGRRPVIVTTTHFSTRVCVERSRRAQAAGAAMVMVMPPYHGATVRAAEPAIFEFFQALSDAIDIPIMLQDAPVSGTPLPPAFLARMAREIANLAYFKIETAGAAAKLREMIRLGAGAIEGPWDGEESITLLADLDAGATGTMPSGAYPDLLGPIVRDHAAGRRVAAVAAYEMLLPLINYENRQCGLAGCKALMQEGGIIASDMVRHPLLALHPATRAGLLEIARPRNPLVLRWNT